MVSQGETGQIKGRTIKIGGKKMKKILVLSLALVLVFSSIALATNCDPLCGDSTDLKVKINENCKAFFDTPAEWSGLFGNGDDAGIGEPGVYISNGKVTKDDVVGTGGLWETVLTHVPAYYSSYFTEANMIFDPATGDEGSELFSIDANTNVNVTISSDWDDADKWLDTPTLLMVYSVEDLSKFGADIPDGLTDENWNGIGTDWMMYAYIANAVGLPFNGEFTNLIEAHNDIVDSPTFNLDFPTDYMCHGPLDFIITGALLIPKASQVAAENYEATIYITVDAADEG